MGESRKEGVSDAIHQGCSFKVGDFNPQNPNVEKALDSGRKRRIDFLKMCNNKAGGMTDPPLQAD
jgi:hypothetical protein